jgi:hypothetical protein
MARRRPLLLLTLLLGCHKPDPGIPQARQELDSFAKSVREYREQKGRWPPSLLDAVGRDCLGESHKCLSDDAKRLDPWGSKYEYDQSLHSALLRSPGPDKRLGTHDDLEANVPAPAGAAPAPAPAAPANPPATGGGGAPR